MFSSALDEDERRQSGSEEQRGRWCGTAAPPLSDVTVPHGSVTLHHRPAPPLHLRLLNSNLRGAAPSLRCQCVCVCVCCVSVCLTGSAGVTVACGLTQEGGKVISSYTVHRERLTVTISVILVTLCRPFSLPLPGFTPTVHQM